MLNVGILRRRGQQYRRALQARNQAIVAAHEAGMSLRAIGEVVGLSHTAVAKIVHRHDQ